MRPAQQGAVTAVLIGVSLAVARTLSRPKPVVTRTTLPPVPLEPWEEIAEFGGEVGGDEGAIPEEGAVAPIGTGDPEDLCFPAENPAPEEVCVAEPLEDPRFAPRVGVAPVGDVGSSAMWPVSTRHRRRLVTSYWTDEGIRGAWGRHFGAKRVGSEGQLRRHAGVDLFGYEGDLVMAPEDGLVLAILPFHHGTWALYLRTTDGRVLTLGEIRRYSWREFGVAPNTWVKRGSGLARLGVMTGGGQMLHFELHDPGAVSNDDIVSAIRRGEFQWSEETPPPTLLDPSAYLVDAATRTYRMEKEA